MIERYDAESALLREELEEDEEPICGEAFDHDQETTYEDGEIWQGVCRYCGAELEYDKTEGQT